MKKKPFDICQELLCRRKVIGGKPQKDITKRWCHYHLPEKLAKFLNAPKKLCPSFSEKIKCRISKNYISDKTNVCQELSEKCDPQGKCIIRFQKWRRISAFERKADFEKNSITPDKTLAEYGVD